MKIENYPKASKEVLEILKWFSNSEVKKIPQELIEFLEEIKDTSYNCTITKQDIKDHFSQTHILDETKAILAVIYRDYLATEYQKKKIYEKENIEKQIYREKEYNFDNLFKLKKSTATIQRYKYRTSCVQRKCIIKNKKIYIKMF